MKTGEKIWHDGHGWVTTYAGCDCETCQKEEGEHERLPRN